jgi:hypothetical protein
MNAGDLDRARINHLIQAGKMAYFQSMTDLDVFKTKRYRLMRNMGSVLMTVTVPAS